MRYNKPFFEAIDTQDMCDYGCNTLAKYRFRNGKICCSSHYNSCQGKRKLFSDLDHTERAAKSLATRTRLGITKTSQISGGKTRRENGHYDKLSTVMQQHWAENPWQNNPHCPLVAYKSTNVNFQGSYEYEFLEMLEEQHGIEWLNENVARGPSLWYNDPTTNTQRLYISDFIIGNTIYEIKSSWTWNKLGKDLELETKNKSKLNAARKHGYEIILVLDGRQINEAAMDGSVPTY